MTLSGMNIAEIRSIASQLRRYAADVQQCSRDVDRLLQTARSNWSGPDLSEFMAKWNGQTRGIAQRVEAELRELADTAERNAQAQQVTSDELGDSTGGGGGGGGGGGAGGGGLGGGGGGSWDDDERDRGVSDLEDFVDNPEQETVIGREHEWPFGDQPDDADGGDGDSEGGEDKDGVPLNVRYDIAEGEGLIGNEVSAGGSVGDENFGARGEASATVGLKGEYGVYAGTGGLVATAGIMAGAQASASGSAYVGPATVAGEASAMAGVSAEGAVALSATGVSAQAEAFAGAKAEASGSADIGGVGVTGTAEAWAGVGIEANVDIGITDGKLTIGGSFGAALGVGGSVGGGITIDLNKVGDSLSSAADAVGDFFGGLW